MKNIKGFAKMSSVLFLFLAIVSIPFFTEYTEINADRQSVLKADYTISDTIDDHYLSFDGIDDWVDLGFVPPSSNNARTFYITFKLPQQNAKWFLSYGTESEAQRFSIEISNQKLRLDIRGEVVELDYTIPLNEWTTYIFTMSDENSLLNTENYINGNLITLNRIAGTQININTGNSNTLRIGRLNDFSLYSSITVKELGVFNTYNNSTLVNNLFLTGIEGTETGLISYYDFNDGSGTILTDTVGNNDGIIYGATWVNNSIQGLDSYQVMENFRNNAVNTNYFGFITTIVTYGEVAISYVKGLVNFFTVDNFILEYLESNAFDVYEKWWFRPVRWLTE